MGLNATMLMSGRAMEVFAAGIQVAGNNVANANTPGFIREELKLSPAPPYRQGNLIFGTGVEADGVKQIIDQFLEKRIYAANADAAAAGGTGTIYGQLENLINELGANDLSTSLSHFLNALHDVVNQPESAPLRELVLRQGEQFSADVVSLRSQVNALRAGQGTTVEALVDEANDLIKTIADLNPQISTLEASGLLKNDAGNLRVKRYNAMNRLSEIIPISYVERKDGGVDVFTGSDFLVLNGTYQQLVSTTEPDRGVNVQTVRLSETGNVISQAGGELGGIVNGRDTVVGDFIDDLDTFASNLIFEFNKIHSSGEGLIGYESVTSQESVLDTAAALNSAAAGLQFSPSHGSFDLKIRNKLTGLTTTTNIPIDLDGIGSETSLQDLQAAIDAVADVSASITTTGRLKIDADPNFEVRFSNDTSGALAALGINTFFTGYDSATMGVNPVVAADGRLLATGRGLGPSDNRTAIELADFSGSPLAALGNISLEDFYERMVSKVAQGAATDGAVAEGLNALRDSLIEQRMQISGVSLDEEAIKILQFQHSYQAAARLIGVIDELFTTLLNM